MSIISFRVPLFACLFARLFFQLSVCVQFSFVSSPVVCLCFHKSFSAWLIRVVRLSVCLEGPEGDGGMAALLMSDGAAAGMEENTSNTVHSVDNDGKNEDDRCADAGHDGREGKDNGG